MQRSELPKDVRQQMLAKIHLAKKQLGLPDEEYRSLLERVAGVRSAADLDAGGLVKVMEEFLRLGFRVSGKPSSQGRGGKKGGKLSPQTREKPPGDKSQIDKIRALWIEGYRVGVVKNRYESGLNKFVKRIAKVENVEWLQHDQAQKVIEAIKAMIDRGKKDE